MHTFITHLNINFGKKSLQQNVHYKKSNLIFMEILVVQDCNSKLYPLKCLKFFRNVIYVIYIETPSGNIFATSWWSNRFNLNNFPLHVWTANWNFFNYRRLLSLPVFIECQRINLPYKICCWDNKNQKNQKNPNCSALIPKHNNVELVLERNIHYLLQFAHLSA